ncbi:hypothetical protein RND71_005557 [Anisodus tanguticus]|uniref:Uncharacterized protein n=1 Tax=Anisodus tanguticus TaxID=243964 RepID=A0AAE1SRQ5_9SOLA|nr:hypothetical protein RND71_005557 [Anisodus tanguticus]
MFKYDIGWQMYNSLATSVIYNIEMWSGKKGVKTKIQEKQTQKYGFFNKSSPELEVTFTQELYTGSDQTGKKTKIQENQIQNREEEREDNGHSNMQLNLYDTPPIVNHNEGQEKQGVSTYDSILKSESPQNE